MFQGNESTSLRKKTDTLDLSVVDDRVLEWRILIE